jgi:hypothetical protein
MSFFQIPISDEPSNQTDVDSRLAAGGQVDC